MPPRLPADKLGVTSLLELLALLTLALGGPFAIAGALVTAAYLRTPNRPLRIAHLVMAIVTLAGAAVVLIVANLDELLCWDCDGPLAWTKAFLPCSLFIWGTVIYKWMRTDTTMSSIAP